MTGPADDGLDRIGWMVRGWQAAIRVDHLIFCTPGPGGHKEVLLRALDRGHTEVLMFRARRGFITDTGRFVPLWDVAREGPGLELTAGAARP